jgi:hypothetical protein
MMTHKERMLRAIRGEWADRLPWTPRIDLWYNANSLRGTLPSKYPQDITLDQIVDDIGGAYHKITPEFMKVRSADDMIDRGIGVYRLWGMPHRAELVGVDREVRLEGDVTHVTYHTPVGSVSCKTVYSEEMKRSGISIPWIAEHVIKGPKDYRPVGYIFNHIKVLPAYDNYLDFHRQVGDKGLAVAFGHNAGSPMHHILKQLVDATKFYLELYDHPDEIRQLCEDMDPFFDQIHRVLADSPAEVILYGSNFDDMITYPPLFRDSIMPYLQRFADLIHPKGKFLLSHCDGENKGLLDLLPESGMDVAEAICPQPMTKVTITEVKKAFKGKLTLWGGIPSIAFLESSMPDEEFEQFMGGIFKEIVPGDRFILSVSDTTPPDARFERLQRITEMVNQWGKLPMTR